MSNSSARPSGLVSFVGAGPGAPELLTLQAVERLRAADVVVHDELVPVRLLELIGATAERIAVVRDESALPDPGAATGRLLARLAAEGRTVVRLKGGDPAVFARLTEELEPLRQAGVRVEFVPGVTAALAAAAAAGVPLTSRDAASSLTIVTGREAGSNPDGVDFTALASLPGTLVVYMGVEQAERWSHALLQAGRPGDTPVTVVSRCSWPDQRIASTTLAACAADFARERWQAPAVAIVGAAARAGGACGPLRGRRVLVVRPSGQEHEAASLVRAAGGECVHIPVIRIVDPPSWAPLDAAIGRLDTYDWIVFASVNGVSGFMKRLRAAGRDGRALGTARLAAIGPATRRAIEEAGFSCDLTPDTFRSEGLAETLAGTCRGGRFLIVRADKGRAVLERDLEAAGHLVDRVVAYVSEPVAAVDPATIAALDRVPVDWILLTSSAIAESAARLFGTRLGRWRIASISSVTSEAIGRLGLRPTVESEESTIESLLHAIGVHESMEAGGLVQAAESGVRDGPPSAGPRGCPS